MLKHRSCATLLRLLIGIKMNHRGFIKSLTPRQRQELTEKSDGVACKNLAVHWGLILLAGWLIAERVYIWPVLMVLQGALLVFLFTLMHETIHRTAFATRSVNDWVARVCGMVILLPPEWFRYFHYAHHRFTQDPVKDPELATGKPETHLQYLKHLSGIPVWIGQLRTLWKNATGNATDSFIPSSAVSRVRSEARKMLSIYTVLLVGSIWFSSKLLLFTWILPVLLGQPLLRFYLLAEHTNCAKVNDMFANTRTTFTNVLVRLFAWNMPYHAEHHAFPNVPFFRLAALHKLMKNHLHETESGYLSFNRKYISAL